VKLQSLSGHRLERNHTVALGGLVSGRTPRTSEVKSLEQILDAS
jgi:hypothetical protein